ncbi:MAG: c-type cytochrome [Anaerolineaceae bacterium]
MKKSVRTVLFVLVLSALILSACGGGGTAKPQSDIPAAYAGKTNPLAADPNAATAGKDIYDTTCAACHGPGGKGDGPAGKSLTPPASDLTKVVATAGDDYLFYRISEGGAMDPYNSSMPAQKNALSEDEIWQVVTYIKTLK